ncbi:MASE1 domain-containing protein [Streptomyces spirodelae]|uniref:MASE1 domain-containing protein n=1 Tax=Streptomyces spirodelae TaxID=2812904 RepID=A0ABS3WQX6_9ACTN|nr:MASE1 domain-containing protein [Streptomyces spirodelae]MBO8185517.1 MASE1 domain-containing protein [Streptomyces spirodelae]
MNGVAPPNETTADRTPEPSPFPVWPLTGGTRGGMVAAYVLCIVVLALSYYAGGRLGLLWRVEVEGAVVTPFWPPTGIAVAGLLYFGLRVWPGVALGSLLVLLYMGPLSWTAAGSVAGSTLAPVVACFLLRRVGFREQVDRLRDGVSLVFLGALLGMLVSATVGCLMLVAGGNLQLREYWPVWSAWWAGDAVGVLVVTPLLLSLPKLGRPRNWVQAGEAVGLAAATTAVAIVVTRAPIDLLFLVFPLLVWAALRFQLAGSAVSTTILAIAATWGATDRAGVFARQDLITDMVTLQALNGSAALTTLLLAAVTAEKRNTHRRIAAACDDLAEMVEVLAPQGRGPRSFPAGGRTGQRQG